MARWVGLQKSYVINGVGHEKILCLLTRWVGGSENGLKYAYVIFEWSLITVTKIQNFAGTIFEFAASELSQYSDK